MAAFKQVVRACEFHFNESKLALLEPLCSPAKESLEELKKLEKEAESYVSGDKIPTLVPIGPGQCGKSHFINKLSLSENLPELQSSDMLQYDKDEWDYLFPVACQKDKSSTCICTRIAANKREEDRTFRAKLVFTEPEIVKRRKELYFTEEQGANQLSERDLAESLLTCLKAAFSDIPSIQVLKEPLTGEVDLCHEADPNRNLFVQLAGVRAKVAEFEKTVRGNPALCWLVELHIQGPFTSLRRIGIELADV